MRRRSPNVTRSVLALVGILVAGALSLGSSAVAADLGTKVSELSFPDAALDRCVKNWATQEGYLTVADVKEIPCFNLGITSIVGLEIFTEALVIDLSRNQIEDFSPLFGLTTLLGYIDIHANRIRCGHMIKLSQALKQAWRVGFDTNNCIPDEAPTNKSPDEQPDPRPAPTPPVVPPAPPPAAPATPASPTVSYGSVAKIISDACGSCHQAGKHKGGVALDDEQQLLHHGRAVLSDIERGSMPPKDHTWGQGPDGKIVVKYLQEQIAAGRIPAGKAPKHDDDDDDDEHDDDDDKDD